MPPVIVTEYCARGALHDVLRSAREFPAKAARLDWARRLGMVGGRCALGEVRG